MITVFVLVGYSGPSMEFIGGSRKEVEAQWNNMFPKDLQRPWRWWAKGGLRIKRYKVPGTVISQTKFKKSLGL